MRGAFFTCAGGTHQHVNHFQRLITRYFPAMVGVDEINVQYAGGARVRGIACEREATAMVCTPTGELKHIALHHDDSNLLSINISAPKEVARHAFIASDKHNGCPLILIRNKTAKETATIMWHLSYSHLCPRHGARHLPVNNKLPKYLREGQLANDFPSIRDAFTNPNAEILVTNSSLLTTQALHANGQRKLLSLPNDLKIVPAGLEESVRSYSAIYFPVEDKLIISGYDRENTPQLWLMSSPFSGHGVWHKSSVSQLERSASKIVQLTGVEMQRISILRLMEPMIIKSYSAETTSPIPTP